MNISQGNLVVIGANTAECKVFWNGKEITDIVGVNINNEGGISKVILKLKEDPSIAEMMAAGIIIRRV